jgi:hypothetical protein
VTVWEDRTVMKTCYHTVQETCMKKELVRLGHWECREVCGSSLFSGLGHSCCSDPCGSCCPPTRTKKVWVHCPEYCERPHTVCKKVCTQVPQVCKVAVCKTVWEDCTVQVCTYQCVTESRVEKYTVMVPHQVTYKATRTVRVCVPYEVDVTCCRMVPRTRTVQVQDCCSSPCCPTRGGLFSGLFSGRGCHHSCHSCESCGSCCK